MTDLGRRVLIGLAVLALILVVYVALPLAEPLLVAAVLASAFSPWFERLARTLRQRRPLAAAFFVAAVGVTFVLPLAGIVLAVAQQAEDALGQLRTTFQTRGLAGVLEGLPQPLPVLAREVLNHLPRGEQQLEELIQGLTGRVLRSVGYLFVATGNLLFQTAMMLVGFFFLLVEGPALVRWIIQVSPLREDQMKELLADFQDVSVAVLVGSMGTALVQTLVAVFGYWFAGSSQLLLLAAATFVGAFIPVVGAGAVVVAEALLLFVTGHSAAGLFLAAWGVGVVSSIDNFVKPYLMRGRLEVNMGVTFFALLGGVASFGPVGLLAGPLVVAFFMAVVRMCQREFQSVARADPPTEPAAHP
jgi:predicted PurR-regulated permease PerM